jgi:hypothetical protein
MTHTRFVGAALIAIACACSVVLAQSPASSIQGSWSATAVPNQVFQGTWTAEPVSADPNAAQGSWTLVNRSNQIVMRGTWSAVKNARVWSGNWQARVATSRGATSRLLSGTWRTEMTDANVQSLAALLQKTLSDQINGTWGSGGLRGAWSLRAFR